MLPTLQFQDVHRSFGHKKVLCGLDFSVAPGEIVGFLGANGAGKTTAIYIALGLLHPSHGSGTMMGRPLGDPQGRRRVGAVLDPPAFFRHSARDAVRFAAKLQDVPDCGLRSCLEHVFQSVPIANSHGPVRNLSRGQQQLVAMAQALAHGPDLLVLDEPTSALDPSATAHVRAMLLAARNAGKSVFLSSHQLTEVERTCDRALFLHNGRIARQGTLQELAIVTDDKIVTVRGASLAATVWEGLSPVAVDNAGTVKVTVPSSSLRPLLEKVWAAGGEVLEMTPARRGLEELFLSPRPTAPQRGPGDA